MFYLRLYQECDDTFKFGEHLLKNVGLEFKHTYAVINVSIQIGRVNEYM